MSLLELFCHVDDFCQRYPGLWTPLALPDGARHRQRARGLSLSEVMTILIVFHQTHYRNFKAFYTEHVQAHLQEEFPGLVSYGRFVEFMPATLLPFCAYFRICCGTCTGLSFVDSTVLAVCHNRRIAQHKVFAERAARGKNSVGWFFGFKLHLVFNDRGEILNIVLTPGNVDDRTPVPQLVKDLCGRLFGDKGYISKPLADQLRETFGIQLITKIRSNMRNQLIPLADKLLLRKRSIVETIIDQLKNISQIEHTRHRSPFNFLINLLCGLIAYCHQPKKPSLHLHQLPQLPA